MKQTKKIMIIGAVLISLTIALYAMASAACWVSLHLYDGSISRTILYGEQEIRMGMVSTAKQWLGSDEGSDRHQQLLCVYNSHKPLARNYEVKPDDNWCAAFVSAVAIQQNLTDLIPTECGCERQIGLWQNMGRWVEDDNYLPLPGDYIYYNWDASWDLADNTEWSDHVGIVVGTSGPALKIIEGNKDDTVTYRIIFRWDFRIRGYGLPDYVSKVS